MQELDLARGQGLLASSRGDGVNEGGKERGPRVNEGPFPSMLLNAWRCKSAAGSWMHGRHPLGRESHGDVRS